MKFLFPSKDNKFAFLAMWALRMFMIGGLYQLKSAGLLNDELFGVIVSNIDAVSAAGVAYSGAAMYWGSRR